MIDGCKYQYMMQVEKVVFGQQLDSPSFPKCENSSCFPHPRTIILGFSKGGTVINQLVTELGFSDVASIEKSPHLGQRVDTEFCIVPKTKETFLNSIDEIHYVDVGLNSTGAYLTNRDVIEGISKRLMQGAPGIRFMLHGTPRQWSDERRGWIRQEKDTLLHLLESEAHKSGGQPQVYEKFYFADSLANLQMHFEIIERLDVNL